jgi:hypothetical protein
MIERTWKKKEKNNNLGLNPRDQQQIQGFNLRLHQRANVPISRP